MDIDALFKAPAPKRKADMFASLPPAKARKTGEHEATVEDVPEEHDEDGVGDAPAPETGAADAVPDDEDDPRFFGDGLSAEDRRILDLVDTAESVDVAELDLPALKKVVSRFEKAYKTNLSLRSKYPSDPSRFLDSEVELDAEARALAILATAPHLYRDAVALNVPDALVRLLTHENPDIGMAAVEVATELLDDDVINPEDDDVGLDTLRGIREFVADLLERDFLPIVEAAFRREPELHAAVEGGGEEAEAERDEALYKYLALLDNLLGVDETMAGVVVAQTKFLDLILAQLRPADPKSAAAFSPLRAYAAELLAVLVQNGGRAARTAVVAGGGLDLLLTVLSGFRKRDPDSAETAEFMENAFDAVCLCLSEPEAQQAFRDAEGGELMVLLIKKRQRARIRAVRVLNYATQLTTGGEDEAVKTAVHLVADAGVLGCVFPLFMQQDHRKMAKAYKTEFSAVSDDEHLACTLANLVRAVHRALAKGGDEAWTAKVADVHARLLRKFAEDGHAKVIQVVKQFAKYHEKLAAYDATRREEEDDDEELDADRRYLDRLDRGLSTLSQLAILLGFLVRDDDECRELVPMLLQAVDLTPAHVAAVLKDYLAYADPGVVAEFKGLVDQFEN
ncbi:hypothetical protein H9P43_009655 [Blastocladiella emersonii ATCC 22665]|nr:hypothetical protein H9P43_009655 [Blastocladiella emersonii ATCC 22665]